MQVKIEQGSKEWLDLRKTKITATDTACIMGANPWKTSTYLMNQKLGITPEDPVNEAMKEGSRLELIARKDYQDSMGIFVIPTVHIGTEKNKYIFMMCSTDGLSFDGKVLLEIKCGKKAFELCGYNVIPEYYKWQIQKCLLLTGAEECHYYCYQEEDGLSKRKLIKVMPDNNYFNSIIQMEIRFFEQWENHRKVNENY